MKKSILTFLLLACFVPTGAQQFADTQGQEKVQTTEALVSSRDVSASTRTHDTWRLNSGDSNARLFVGSRANLQGFNIGVARVTGKVFLDRVTPANSKIELVLYPADADGPTDFDGKLASGRSPSAIDYSELIFKSERIAHTKDGALNATGELTLVRVERSVDATPSEAYAGPVYGDPVVHTITRQATFVLRNLAPDPRPRMQARASRTSSRKFRNELAAQNRQSRFPVASRFFRQADLLRRLPTVQEIKGSVITGYAVTVEVQL